jgi:hypothetical protein
MKWANSCLSCERVRARRAARSFHFSWQLNGSVPGIFDSEQIGLLSVQNRGFAAILSDDGFAFSPPGKISVLPSPKSAYDQNSRSRSFDKHGGIKIEQLLSVILDFAVPASRNNHCPTERTPADRKWAWPYNLLRICPLS